MTVSREVREGKQGQGVAEKISYSITTTPWGSAPTSVVAAAYDVTNSARTNVTTLVYPVNTPTINGDVITLSPLGQLVANRRYRVEVSFTVSGNTEQCFFFVDGSQ